MSNLKEKVAKGAVWTLAEKISCQAVSFVVGMILARLLTPTDYGTGRYLKNVDVKRLA